MLFSNLHFLEHDTGDHPENASRLKAILEAFQGQDQQLLNLSINRYATEDELGLVHDNAYIKYVLSLDGKQENIDVETVVSPQSVKAALLAAGLGVELVEQTIPRKIQNSFALVRPPGHHARPSIGMGFCIFNNIAIAAKKALSLGVKRILIFDWDVHHGNGTQEVFYDDDRVLFVDIHQENLFPVNSGLVNDTGNGKGVGFNVNIPLPPSSNDQDYLYAFDHLVKPLAMRYRPELILVSAGFDAHESDPLGFMKLTTNGFGLLTQRIKWVADHCCEGKLIFFLEGGYNPFFLAKNVAQCARALLQSDVKNIELIETSNIVKDIVGEIYDSHFKY